MKKEMVKSVTVTIRLDPEMHECIVAIASRHFRTFNLEVQNLLQKGIERHEAEQEAIRTKLDEQPMSKREMVQ